MSDKQCRCYKGACGKPSGHLPEVPEYDNRFSLVFNGVKFGITIPGDPRDMGFNKLVKFTVDSNFGERPYQEELRMETET